MKKFQFSNDVIFICIIIILAVVCTVITYFIPNFGVWLILLACGVWWLSDRTNKVQQTNDNEINPNLLDEIYEYIHNELLLVFRDVFSVLGCQCLIPRSLKVNPTKRIYKYGNNLFYRYGLTVPDTFSIQNNDLLKLINDSLHDHVVPNSPIPIVIKIIRREQKILLVATTCPNEEIYQYVLEKYVSNHNNAVPDKDLRKDEDF